MIKEQELTLMKEAYANLYEIENRLRLFAVSKMEKDFGCKWRLRAFRIINNSCTKTKLEELNFHQLVSYFRIFPSLSSVLPSKVFLQLFDITSVRNKIAHSHLISEVELQQLCQINELLSSLLCE